MSAAPSALLEPTPFKWRDPASFPRRRFAYGGHYVRRFLSVTAATTKTGKSTLSLVEAVAMATGRNLLGVEPMARLKVWYWNGEDPLEEIERRVMGICLHYGIVQSAIEGKLYLDSGRDAPIIIATQRKDGIVVSDLVEKALTDALIAGQFDILIIDPVVSVHRVSENDNTAIDAVAKTFSKTMFFILPSRFCEYFCNAKFIQ